MSSGRNKYCKFEYHLEYLDCTVCLHYKRKRENRRSKYYGCDRFVCCREGIRAKGIAKGSVLRDRRWNKWAG